METKSGKHGHRPHIDEPYSDLCKNLLWCLQWEPTEEEVVPGQVTACELKTETHIQGQVRTCSLNWEQF